MTLFQRFVKNLLRPAGMLGDKAKFRNVFRHLYAVRLLQYFSQATQFASSSRGEKCAMVLGNLLGDRITGEDFSDMHRAERDFTAADDAFHVH